MVLDLFSDWPTQELGFFGRLMTELALPKAVSQAAGVAVQPRARVAAPADARWWPTGRGGVFRGQPIEMVYFVLEGSVRLQCQHPTKYGDPPRPYGVVAGANRLLCATARVHCCSCTTSTRRRSAERSRCYTASRSACTRACQ